MSFKTALNKGLEWGAIDYSSLIQEVESYASSLAHILVIPVWKRKQVVTFLNGTITLKHEFLASGFTNSYQIQTLGTEFYGCLIIRVMVSNKSVSLLLLKVHFDGGLLVH